MELVVRLLVSFLAGFLSFITPCVLPLVPSYITFLGGTTVQELNSSNYDRKRIFIRALFFVAGFSIVFTLAGLLLWGAFSVIGTLSIFINQIVNIAAGIIVILLGLNIIFDFFSLLNREKRAQVSNRPENNIGALLVGMAFGAGWSPCIGPILFGIISLTATSDSVLGVFSLVMYSIGLGIPFLLLSLAFVPVSSKLGNIKKFFPVIKIVSGIFLIFVGILILLGRLISINAFFTDVSFIIQGLNKDYFFILYLFFLLLYAGLAGLAVYSFIKKMFVAEAKKFSIISLTLAIIFITLFILQLSGVISTELLIADWLLLQELNPIPIQ